MAEPKDTGKIKVKSYASGLEQVMTPKEFEDFQAGADPQKTRFYNAGSATPEEVAKIEEAAKGPAAPKTAKAQTERTSAGASNE